jgi:hypothetical protein
LGGYEESQNPKWEKLLIDAKEIVAEVFAILSRSGVGLWGSTGANGRLDDCHSFKIAIE